MGKEERKEYLLCDCDSVLFASSKVPKHSEETLGILESVGLKCSTTEIPIPTPFCKHYYCLVYKTKVPFQANCVVVNALLKFNQENVHIQIKLHNT